MTVTQPHLSSHRTYRREISHGFFRAFTPLGWICWLLALAAATYLSWSMARLCVEWMAA